MPIISGGNSLLLAVERVSLEMADYPTFVIYIGEGVWGAFWSIPAAIDFALTERSPVTALF